MSLFRISNFAAALLALPLVAGAAQAATTTAAPTLLLYSVPSLVWIGNNTTVHWRTTDATSCTAGGDWSGSFGDAGAQFETKLTTSKNYTMTCKGPGGTVTKSFPVKVIPKPGSTDPTLLLYSVPSLVWIGNNTTVNWRTENVSSCTASGDWSGAYGAAGSQFLKSLQKSVTYTMTCKGTNGSTVTKSFPVTVIPKPSTTVPSVTVSATPTTVTAGSTATVKWSATDAQSCAASGGFTASNLAATGSKAVTNIMKNTTFTLNCTNSVGAASKSTVVLVQTATSTSPPTTPPVAGAVSRPSYNTGNGFFVLNGKLYDPDGIEFRIRGVNRAHYDSGSEAGIAKSQANAARVFVSNYWGKSFQDMANIVQNEHIAHQELGIPTDANYTTCSSDTAKLSSAVANWVNNASAWTPLNRHILVNIGNEWGPSNSTVWRDANIDAVKKLRAAGYTGALLIDSGGCGQDINDLLNYSTDVFNADPQKNLVFSLHIYGNVPPQNVAPDLAKLHALSQSVGMAFLVGEFGPGRNIGPSPTTTTPGQVITAAENNGIGWLAWAWDDNNLANCGADDNWFAMSRKCGGYTQASDLTLFGQDVVLNATYGLQAIAKKPNW